MRGNLSSATRGIVFLLALSAFLLLSESAFAQQTYYIDCAAGSDANNGTAKATPWQHAPGMVGRTGSYTHVAGDRFIFKGGVTCPASFFPWTISSSGTSGSRDYYGVDQTWYSGASWARPIFDGERVTTMGQMITINGSFLTFDNFEIKNHGAAVGTIPVTLYLGGSNNIASYIYIHAHYVSSCTADSANGFFGIALRGTNNIIDHYTKDGSDGVPAGTIGGAIGTAGGTGNTQIRYSTIHDVPNAICCGTYGDVFGNTIYNVLTSCAGTHENAIENLSNAWRLRVYNNLIHDVRVGVVLLVCGNTDIYNNVFYHNGPSAIQIDTNCGGEASAHAYVYNNTIEGTNYGAGILGGVNNRSGATLGALTIKNNHGITNAGGAMWSNMNLVTTLDSDSGTSSEPIMTLAQAAAAGYTYTETNPYSPPSGSSPTVGVALSLTSSCGSLPGQCSDKLGVARPTSGPWSAGAYEAPQSTSGKPIAPTNLTATVQ